MEAFHENSETNILISSRIKMVPFYRITQHLVFYHDGLQSLNTGFILFLRIAAAGKAKIQSWRYLRSILYITQIQVNYVAVVFHYPWYAVIINLVACLFVFVQSGYNVDMVVSYHDVQEAVNLSLT